MTEQIQGNPGPADGMSDMPVQEFHNTQNIVMVVTTAFGFSLLMIALIAVNLYTLFTSLSPKPLMPGLIGGMSVVPIFGITAGIYFLRRPRKIIIGPQGLVIVGVMSRKEIGWRDIADVEIKEVESIADNWIKSFSGHSAVQKKRVVLRNASRSQLGAIDGNIAGFDTLAAMIVSYSSQCQGKSVFNTDLQKSRTIDARKKKMRLNLGLGLFLSLMAIASMVFISIDHFSQQALESQGQTIQAVISKHFKYNITPRLEYTFTAADGKAYTKDVMVEKGFWENLKEGDPIQVKYVPGDPDNSRLLEGYVNDFDVPFPLMLVMGIAILALGAGCACMYFFKIVDIKHENGKWIIVRLNDPELSITPSAPAPAAAPQVQPQLLPVFSPAISSPQYPAASQEKQKLPGGLKAIGILNIIFGVLGFLSNGFQLMSVLIIIISSKTSILQTEGLPDWKWILYGPGLSLLCSFALCVSGIGILQFANWGRILAVLAAAGKLILGLIEILDIIFTPLKTEDIGSEYMIIVSKLFACFIVFLFMIYPLIVYLLLNRRSTRQCFQNKNIN